MAVAHLLHFQPMDLPTQVDQLASQAVVLNLHLPLSVEEKELKVWRWGKYDSRSVRYQNTCREMGFRSLQGVHVSAMSELQETEIMLYHIHAEQDSSTWIYLGGESRKLDSLWELPQ